LRPRAAATKNKMRIAEKAFIYLIGDKKYSWAGFTLQIFLTSFMGQKQFFVEDLIELKFHNNFIWEKYGQKEGEKNTVMSSHSATIYSDTSVSTLPLR
jgi:hypothetical protein